MSACRREEGRRGLLRIGLGLAQVVGATLGLYLLLHIGARPPILVVVAATLLLTVVNRLIFGGAEPERNGP